MGNKSKRTQKKCVRRTMVTKATSEDDFVGPILGRNYHRRARIAGHHQYDMENNTAS